MRLSLALLGVAAASLAMSATAQNSSAPAQAPATTPAAPAAPPARGLSGLEDTVSQLQDAQATAAQATAASPAHTAPARTRAAAAARRAAPTPAATPAPVRARGGARAPLLTAAQIAAIAAAVPRGHLLGAIAQAGQLGTQDMLAHVSDPAGAGISGWIAEPEGNAVNIIFYAAAANGAPPAAIYRVSILGGRATARATYLAGNRPPLTPHEARLAAARAATEALDHHPCGGEDFNVFVVPPATPDAPIDVYQLSPQTQRGQYPLGGHFRSTVAADGTIVSQHAFAEGCASVAASPAVAGTAPVRLEVARPTESVPTEIDVFLALWTGHPLLVTAGDPPRPFAVTGEAITEIRN